MLAQGFAIDLDEAEFPAGSCAATKVAHVGVQVWYDGDGFTLSLPHSFAQGFKSWLEDASRPYGVEVRAWPRALPRWLSTGSGAFDVGAVVALRSGGPSMTVLSVSRGIARCKWFDGRELRAGQFDLRLICLHADRVPSVGLRQIRMIRTSRPIAGDATS